MKPWLVHYRNKYPDGAVLETKESIDVFCKSGLHRVALRKTHAGWQCASKEMGCVDVHNLAPIPKDARVWKLYKNGDIALSEEGEHRKKISKEISDEHKGKIPSIQELYLIKNPEADPHSGYSSDTNWQELKPLDYGVDKESGE